MADFGTALQWMKEGKKVRRPMWGNKVYCFLDELTAFQTNTWGGSSPMNTWPTQAVMANDWEIYEELQRWSKGDTAFVKVEVICQSGGDHHICAAIRHRGDRTLSTVFVHQDDLLTAAEIKEKQ